MRFDEFPFRVSGVEDRSGESSNSPVGSGSSPLLAALVNKPLPLKLSARERHCVQKFGTLEATLGRNGDQRGERGPIKGNLTKPVASHGSVTRSNGDAKGSGS